MVGVKCPKNVFETVFRFDVRDIKAKLFLMQVFY